jgi:hypothetical protein
MKNFELVVSQAQISNLKNTFLLKAILPRQYSFEYLDLDANFERGEEVEVVSASCFETLD